MKIYKIDRGILLERQHSFYLLEDENWDEFINDDELYEKIEQITASSQPIDNGAKLIANELNAPIKSQEIWASGVTYYNSKLGREEESKETGGSDFYARVYDAERPELFFKATGSRTVGSGEKVRIREDSTWDVPEPELTLVITSSGKIVGYTIGNDMSSRSIEGENPLYLPQAKCYDGSAAIGPCVFVTNEPLPSSTTIALEVEREGTIVFKDSIEINQIKRKFTDLVAYLYRECSFPHGSLLMTGTGIVPSNDFSLHHGDEISISIAPIGTLINEVD
ncbi:MAG TPA: fumarylacetoacetate hydrolase family protein [Balneolaceae bacterium]|nr:fumarylacetoacetate hydrolase family protein [Balneolaceae bacterium]